MADLYATLGIARDASADDIKQAYRKMAKKHHPDREGGNAAAFNAMTKAYDVLSDPARRAKYDQTGDDSVAPDNIDATAKNLIIGIFLLVMNEIEQSGRNPESHDLISEVRVRLMKPISEADQADKNTDKAVAKLRKLVKRIKHKKGDPLFELLINGQIAASEQQRVARRNSLLPNHRALELLADFSFEAETPKTKQSPGGFFVQFTTS